MELTIVAKIVFILWMVAVGFTLVIIGKGAIYIFNKFKKPKPKRELGNTVIFPEDFNPRG